MADKNSSLTNKEEVPTFERHGSIRKVLHSLVGNDSLLNISARMLDRPKSNTLDHNLNPYQEFLREYALISEYNLFCQHLIPGLYIMPSANSSLVWFGVIFIRSGLYKGAILRFRLHISENFPDTLPPRIIFENKIFHPCINFETQELNLLNPFNDWSKFDNHLWQVLEYLNNIFYEIPIDNAENLMAINLYKNDIEKFKEIINKCVDESHQNIYNNNNNNDAHYFIFNKFDESIHNEARLELAKPLVKTSSSNHHGGGLSWVKEGTFKACSNMAYNW